uniref:Uncharacterized protein n=1 Tax=Anguilla anguilla TaxID=7936 RepID=A0A0E9VLJ6_ANGAN
MNIYFKKDLSLYILI